MRDTLQQKTAFAWVLLTTCGLLFIVVGSSLILLARKLSKKQFQFAAIVVLLGFIYVWAELAVGVFFSFGS